MRLYSSLAMGFNEACLDVDDIETFELAVNEPERFILAAIVLDCPHAVVENEQIDKEGEAWEDSWNVGEFFAQGENNCEIEPLLTYPFNTVTPDFRPTASSPLRSGAILPDDVFFEPVEFIGAMGENDWTVGWTNCPEN